MSGTAALPWVVSADTVLGAEELVSLGANARVVHSRQFAVPDHQFLGTQAPPPGMRARVGDLGAVAVMWFGLPHLARVHHGRRVNAELTLGDVFTPKNIAPCALMSDISAQRSSRRYRALPLGT